MRAITDFLNKVTTEPVITNAIRKASGKPPVTADALAMIEQLGNSVSSLENSKISLAQDKALRDKAKELGLFTVRVVIDETKTSTVFGAKVLGLGGRKTVVSEIDDVTSSMKAIIARLDSGIKTSDVANDVKAAKEAEGVVYKNLRTVSNIIYPPAQPSAFEQRLEAQLDAIPAKVNAFFDGVDARIEAFDKARADKRAAERAAEAQRVAQVSHAPRREHVSRPYDPTKPAVECIPDYQATKPKR